MKFGIGIIMVMFIAGTMQAQVIGGNGEGFSANFSEFDITALQQLAEEHPIAIRWPGGGDSKVAFPAINKPGLGMNIDSINKLYDDFRDGQGLIKVEALEKDLKKAEKDILAEESELMHLIRTSRVIPNFQVSYALNVLQGTPETNLLALQTLIDSGVHVIAVVAGNETFASYNYDWERYKKDFEPILKAIQKKYPDLPRLLCIAQDIDRKTHIKWNTQLIQYIQNSGDFISGVDIHYYLFNELKAANAIHPGTVTIKQGQPNEQLDKAFKTYIELYRTADQMQLLVGYLQLQLPGKILHCSEFGDKEAEYWSNTVANGAHLFMTFCINRNSFDVLLLHNLIGNWMWAARRPVTKLDGLKTDDNKLNRIPWFAIQLANELPLSAKQLSEGIDINSPGTYYYFFDCAGDPELRPELALRNSSEVSFELHFVTGKYPYSSAGATGFWAKDSDPFFEVDGIDVVKQTNQLVIPANSFGYVKVIVE